MNIFTLIILFTGLFNSYKTEVTEAPFCITSDEKQLFEILNAYRDSRNLEAIPFSVSLSKVARAHVRDLVENYEFKQGSRCNPHSWSKAGDWSSCCYTNDHKKAACMWDKPKEIAGYESQGYEILFYSSDGSTPAEALNGWQKSPGHHALVINSGQWEKVEWKAMGIGIYGEYAVTWFGVLEEVEPLNQLLVCD